MKANKLQQTIVQNIRAYGDYPFQGLDQTVLELFNPNQLHQFEQQRRLKLLKAIECFLQITGKRVTGISLNSAGFRLTCHEFLGALYSDHFISLTNGARYAYGRTLIALLTVTKQYLPAVFNPDFHLSSLGPTEFIQNCSKQFQELELDEEKVWLWRGWPSTSRDGKATWLPLYPIYERLGRDFTERIHQACDNYFSARKADRIPALRELAIFIRQYPGELHPGHLRSPLFVTRFWREFFSYYLESRYEANVSISTLIQRWRAGFLFFVTEYLVPSGLFAEPYGALPAPDPKMVSGTRSHIKMSADGAEVQTKLLTHIPLQVSDREAMELLFKQIQADVDLIVKWAERAVDDIWIRYRRRIELAPVGRVRIIQAKSGNNKSHASWLTNRRTPDHLKNAAATFDHYGYVTKQDIDISLLFHHPLPHAAYELALPVTGSLLPHCVLLTANHPKITPSFLEKLELFDKNSRRIGFVKNDSGYVLDGRKDRKGASKAQQIIELTNLTTKVVQQMIELTDPLRKYLRDRGDDSWRYLLLSCKRGFSYPTRIRKLALETSETERVKALADSLGKISMLSGQERLDYARRFSLPALRASVGVLIYIKERSVKKMAEALGHAEYSPGLLARYLPEPVLAFYQERWIRIFHQGVIAEALKDSEYLMEASSFDSMEELDEFLRTHALKTIPKHLENPDPQQNDNVDSEFSSDTEVVFGVNTGILTAMISLQQAVIKAGNQVCGRATYWAGITERLVGYLESELCCRSDLKSYIAAAKRKADPAKMEALIYG